MGHPVSSNPHPPAPLRVLKGQHGARCSGGDRRLARLKTPLMAPCCTPNIRGSTGWGSSVHGGRSRRQRTCSWPGCPVSAVDGRGIVGRIPRRFLSTPCSWKRTCEWGKRLPQINVPLTIRVLVCSSGPTRQSHAHHHLPCYYLRRDASKGNRLCSPASQGQHDEHWVVPFLNERLS